MQREIRTRAGICVKVDSSTASNPSSVLFFDKPVRAVELTRKEAMRLGSSLIKGSATEATAEKRKLRTREARR
jgi:hypothetical protein